MFFLCRYFFLSGLFVWPSLRRKGTVRFVYERSLRLAVPFILVVAFLMPVTLYPTYLQTAHDASVSGYLRHWLSLPFWPSGPMWFLWLLFVADLAAAALYLFAPWVGAGLIRLSSSAADRPARYFGWFLAASALAYVPLALVFTTSAWLQWGPFAFQLSRPLHYALYFFAGVGIGASGIERGLISAQGFLVRRWLLWVIAAAITLLAWMGLTGLTLVEGAAAPLALHILADLSFVLACFASCFGVLAVVLRFAARRLPSLADLKDSAYGMYLVHYLFVVWLQFALLGVGLPAIVKGALVFGATLGLSWGAVTALRAMPPVAHVIGAARVRGTAPT
jgi:hypothetical protein